MRFAWLSAVKDLRRLWRDPVAPLVWIGIPLFTAVLLNVAFGGHAGPMPQGRLLVADEDGTLLSSLLTSAFSQGELAKMVVVEKVNRAEGRSRIDRGDASALLIIPQGFGQAVLASRPFQLKLITNPAQQILPRIVQESVSIMVEAAFYLQAIAGDQLRLFAAGPPAGAATFPDQTIIATSLALNRIGAKLGTYLNPPLIALETTVTGEKSPLRINFAAAMFPGMLFLTILFVVVGQSGDLWKEREHGTLRRLLATSGSPAAFLAGKVLAAAVVFLALGAVGVAGAHWLLGMPADNPVAAVLWIALSGAGLWLLMALLLIHASGYRAANILAFMVVFPLAMLGGSFFPFEAMPDWLAGIGRLTPNGWAVLELRRLLAGPLDPGRLALACAGLAAAGGVMFPLILRRLRRGFAL